MNLLKRIPVRLTALAAQIGVQTYTLTGSGPTVSNVVGFTVVVP